jgi:hypothetical protein
VTKSACEGTAGSTWYASESPGGGVTPGRPPSAVRSVSAASHTDGSKAIVSFEAPLDSGGLTITGYKVYAYTGGPPTSSNTPATLNSVSVWTGALSPITVSGTTDGTQYWFSARAVNTLRDVNSGEGDISYAGGAQASVT